jgi:N-acyl-D-aspartate/D-glutamate deacylase
MTSHETDRTTVLKYGTVVDGTGASRYVADVAMRGDRIVDIGHDLDGDIVLDVSGMVIAPGFIDIHTHYDAQVFWDPALTPSCFHGVTTVVAGNCGFSIAPTHSSDRDLITHTMEKVEDMAAILGYGVMSTPGVVIDGKVVHSGGVPDRKKIEDWLA